MRKIPGNNAIRALVTAFIASPVDFIRDLTAQFIGRIQTAHSRMRTRPQAGNVVEYVIIIAGVAAIAVVVIAFLGPLVQGYLNKIPK